MSSVSIYTTGNSEPFHYEHVKEYRDSNGRLKLELEDDIVVTFNMTHVRSYEEYYSPGEKSTRRVGFVGF